MRLYAFAIAATTTTLILTTTGTPAQAQGNATDEADALFLQGKEMMTQSRFAEACVLFEKSYALERAEGSLLALGLCHESEGQRARAWRELSSVLVLSTRSGRKDRQRVAQAALTRIAPHVGRIVVRSAAAPTPGGSIELRRDSEGVTASDLDVEVAVEPGHHVVSASRDGRVVWSMDVNVEKGKSSEVIVPTPLPSDGGGGAAVVAPAPEAAHSTTPPTTPIVVTTTTAPSHDRGVPLSAIMLIGAGVATLGTGTYFGLRSMSKWDAVEQRCGGDVHTCRDRAALDDADSSKTAALVSNVMFVTGGALVVTGAVFWYLSARAASSKSTGSATVNVAPLVSKEGGGGVVTASF